MRWGLGLMLVKHSVGSLAWVSGSHSDCETIVILCIFSLIFQLYFKSLKAGNMSLLYPPYKILDSKSDGSLI